MSNHLKGQKGGAEKSVSLPKKKVFSLTHKLKNQKQWQRKRWPLYLPIPCEIILYIYILSHMVQHPMDESSRAWRHSCAPPHAQNGLPFKYSLSKYSLCAGALLSCRATVPYQVLLPVLRDYCPTVPVVYYGSTVRHTVNGIDLYG